MHHALSSPFSSSSMPPPPPQQTLVGGEIPTASASPLPPSSSFAYSPSLLIIAAIVAFVIAASASIHLLLRFLSRSRRRRLLVSPSHPPPPPLHPLHPSPSSSSSSSAPSMPPDLDTKALIDSLPLFTLASSMAAPPKSSPDCAVCLSPFRPDDELRLLPTCRHAFHRLCIDAWLPSTPSCPLCRASVLVVTPPPAPPSDNSRSSSFRIEIGNISRRRQSLDSDPDPSPAPHGRSYSLGSSFEYLLEDEVEAVVARVRRAKDLAGEGQLEPREEVAEEAGGTGRGWLREYVDRLASSASSSFSSLRFSSRHFDGSDGGGARRGSWDLENGDETGYYASFCRWLVGASM